MSFGPSNATIGARTFRGIDPSSKIKGKDAWAALEQQAGQSLAPYMDHARSILNYTDPTGEAEIAGGDWNSLVQQAASMFGGLYQPWENHTGGNPGIPFDAPKPIDDSDVHDWRDLDPSGPGGPWGPPNPNGPYGPLNLPPNMTPPPKLEVKPFRAPSAEDVYRDPSFKFRLGQGTDAIEKSAAAKGVLRTGGTLTGLNDYAQDFASQEYDKVFGRAYDEWRDTYGMTADASDRNWRYTTDVYDRDTDAAVLRDRAWRDDRDFDYGRYRDDRDFRSGEKWRDREYTMREKEFMSNDQFRRFVYGTDQEYRRYRDTIEDAWKLRVLEEERLRYLAGLGR